MSLIKISIIIPIYKVPEEYLRKCIESCINQTLKDIEIILVDDGSPDNCGEICDEYAIKDNRIKVIHKRNEGVSSARNTGIIESSGKYIGFIDADDWIEKDFYAKLLDFAELNKVDFVVSGYVRDKENKIIKTLKTEENKILYKLEAMKEVLKRRIYTWTPCDKIYKLNVIKDKKIFFNDNIKMGEDLDFIWRLLKEINKIGYISLNKYHYCYRKDSVTNVNLAKKKKDSVNIMYTILKETKIIDNDLFNIARCLYLKEIASYCRLMLIQNEKKYRNEIKKYKKEIQSLTKFVGLNFNLKMFLGVLYWNLPYVICKNFKFLIR